MKHPGTCLRRLWIPDGSPSVGVARGGLIPAGAIGYAIGVKAMGAINVEFYTDIGETLPEPLVLSPQLDMDSLAGKRVLVVDDVADSGKTLDLVVNLLKETAAEVRSAVIYTKPTTIFEPDFSWKKTDQWINFAWSALPVITADGSYQEGA